MKKLKILTLVLILMLGVSCLSACSFGYYEVLSDSMAPTIYAGDKVKIKEKDEYSVGDIVMFEFANIPAVHRIIYIDEEGGKTYYLCHGDAVQNADGTDADLRWEDDAAYVKKLIEEDGLTLAQVKAECGSLVQFVTIEQIKGAVVKVYRK